jgi:hypothetical protein
VFVVIATEAVSAKEAVPVTGPTKLPTKLDADIS